MIQRNPGAADNAANSSVSAARAPSRRLTAIDGAARAIYTDLWRGLLPLLPETRIALGITSVHARAGVTTVAAHLARSAGELGLGPALLVETSVHRSGLPEIFDVQANPGLSDWRRGGADLESCLQEIIPDRLTILTAGSGDDQSASLAPCQAAIEELRDRFAIVVCDLGAANVATFPEDLVKPMDGLLLVIEAHRVTDGEARGVKERLLGKGGRLLGAIWNETPSRPASDRAT